MDDKSEPHENDKCMEPQGEAPGGGGMSKLRAQVTSAVANIPSLVIVLLCVLLLVFFVIIVALSVKVHSSAGGPDARCLSAACLRSAGAVLEGLELGAAPCEDPYAFACRSRPEAEGPEEKRRSRWDAASALRHRAHHSVRHLVDLVSTDSDQGSAEAKTKRFYETCMEGRSLSRDALTLFFYRLREVGGWELIGASSWSLQSWSRDAALEKLQVGLGVSPFFAIGVTDRTIRLEPAGFTFPSYEYYADNTADNPATMVLSAYRELIDKVANHLRDGPPSLDNAKLSDIIINYERRLLERLRPRENVTEPSSQLMTVGQLTRMVPIVAWERLLGAYFHGQSIEESTRVLVMKPHYFAGLSQIISTTDTTTINHYMMWRMVMKYAPHLDKTVRALYFRFQQLINGADDPDRPEEEWWEQCARHTSHYLRHAVGYLYATRAVGPRSQDTIKQARAVAERVKKAAVESVGGVAWIAQHGPLREKLLDLEFRVGFAFEDRPKELDSFYRDLIVKLGSHLENVFEAERFLVHKQSSMLSGRQGDETAEDRTWTISAVDTRPVYNSELNIVVVPLAALQKPIFSLDEHLALQYGSFGSLVGRLAFSCLQEAGDNSSLFPDNATRSSLKTNLRCLANSYPNMENLPLVNGPLVAPEALADLAGVTAAFRAFESESSSDKLPGLDWMPEQLFFISYAQSMCEQLSVRRALIWRNVSTSAPKKLRVVQTLQQLPEFGRSFGCSGERNVCHAW